MAEQRSGVLAVVVTYGDRVNFAAGTVREALAQGVDRVVVVSNGLSEESRIRLRRQLHDLDPRSYMLAIIPHNVGSAGGYHVGMSLARQQSSEWVWLLDDDNRPRSGALSELAAAADRSSGDIGGFASLRPADRGFAAIVRGYREAPPSGSFMHFDLLQRFRRSAAHPAPPASLDSAPYGGLMIRREVLDSAVLPDPSLVLYEDDTLFSWNIRRAGYRLIPVNRSIVDDVDTKWSQGLSRTKLLSSSHPERVYYGVRNRTIYELTRARIAGKLPRYMVNGIAFICLRILIEFHTINRRTLVAFGMGVFDGLRNRKGVHNHYRWAGSPGELYCLGPEWAVSKRANGDVFISWS